MEYSRWRGRHGVAASEILKTCAQTDAEIVTANCHSFAV
jgi:hypothetical protein